MNPKFEKVPLGEKKSILAFRFSAKHFDAPWHFHPQYELTFIEKSSGTKFIGDFVGPYKKGELVLLRSNLPHCWKNDANNRSLSSSIVVQWNKHIFAKVPELQCIFTLLKDSSKGIIFKEEDVKKVIPDIKKMIQLKETELYIKLQTLLVKLSKTNYSFLSNRIFIDDLPNQFTTRMRKIHSFIDENYHRKIYLKEVSTLINMTEQSFSRFFSKMMNRPFFTFLNEYRIQTANKMLIDTDWSIREVCFACGYESLSFFHRQFLKFNALTPSNYRTKFKGKAKP